jgi:hypothetical protein
MSLDRINFFLLESIVLDLNETCDELQNVDFIKTNLEKMKQEEFKSRPQHVVGIIFGGD